MSKNEEEAIMRFTKNYESCDNYESIQASESFDENQIKEMVETFQKHQGSGKNLNEISQRYLKQITGSLLLMA